ncbi:MAG: type 1 glutamine amidotransferase [Proteobacteria bacterium]|nr:type 1 glutamine amidotransferase [Pseudomonadota bacterium]
MRVAVVHNMEVSHSGQVGVALAEAGAKVAEYRPYRDGNLPAPDQHDGLVVLGGEQNALDDSAHPYLARLPGVMRAFTVADKAVLGICLGSQVLARAHGGQNQIGTAREFGWTPIRLTDAGEADPVLSAAGAAFTSFEWHSDTFTLPPGAVHLATGNAVPAQAFRVGRASYGMQFHFEANTRVVRDWTFVFPEATEGMRPGWVADHPGEEARHAEAADAAGLAIARAWVAQVR